MRPLGTGKRTAALFIPVAIRSLKKITVWLSKVAVRHTVQRGRFLRVGASDGARF